jgi:surface polysaccharide O-acyltransferase-like enzyme
MRNVIAIISGYLVFALAAVLYFELSEIDPSEVPEVNQIILTILFSGIGSLLSGYITATISQSKKAVVILSIVIVIISVISMLAQPEASKWTQIMTLFLLSPLAYIGGIIRLKNKNANSEEN